MHDDDGETEQRNATILRKDQKGYGCLACGRFLPGEMYEGYWLAFHDNVDHSHMTFNEEDNPQ